MVELIYILMNIQLMLSAEWNLTGHWFYRKETRVVKLVYLRVLNINPHRGYKKAIFPHNLNWSHTSEREHAQHTHTR